MDQEPREEFLSMLDRALDTFSTSVRVVVYYELEKSFGVKREDVPQKPDLFVDTVERLFGVGAVIVKRALMKELIASTGINDIGAKGLVNAMRVAYHKQLKEVA